MTNYKIYSIAALAICFGISTIAAVADDDSTYDAPTPPVRSTLTIHGLQSADDASAVDFQQSQSSGQYRSTSKYATSGSTQTTDGGWSGKNRTAAWNSSANIDDGNGDRVPNPRSGSRSASNGASGTNGQSKGSPSNPSNDQEPKLFSPYGNRQQAHSASEDSTSNWNSSQIATGGRHFSKNLPASYSAPVGETSNTTSTGNTSDYTPWRAGTTSQGQRIGSNSRTMSALAQNTSPSDTDDHVGSPGRSNAASVMSSKPESIAPGSEMNMGNDWSDFGNDGNVSGGCESCNSCNSCCVSPCGCCGWYGEVDYLLVRPSFSEDQAYLKRTTVQDTAENTITTDTVVHQNFDYRSSVRTYFGYRFGCGDEIRFGYWNYGNQSHLLTGPDPGDGSITYAGHLEINTSLPGQRLQVDAGLQMNVYDIDYVKCQCLGGGCNQCNPCGGCCAPWSLKYSAGVRVADVRRGDNTTLLNDDDTVGERGLISADFIGAGPRVGLEGRRFFWNGCASLFARTNFSLLLGEYNLKETTITVDPDSGQSLTENYFDSHARIIPVAEIELGGTWQWSQCVNFSCGYLFQTWWDLGQFEQIEGNVFLNPIDDSNIMAFDGLFARMEICF